MTRVSNWLFLGLSTLSLGVAGCIDDAAGLDPAVDEDVNVDTAEIVGGTATTIAANPWQVALTTNSGFQFCGGSIISPSWVVTANHCVVGGNHDTRVVAGITRVSQQNTGQIRAIDAVLMAPGFTTPETGKDVALLHLSTPLDLSGANARAISLVSAADAAAGATAAGVTSTVTGWGTLSSGGSSPDVLQTVTVPIILNSVATSQYGQTITADQIAAGVTGVGGRDSCQGDSGGPQTVSFGGATKLAGVVSWGNGCALPNFAGLYARVSSFETYINQRINGTLTKPIALTGLSAARGNFTHRSITVPSGARAISFVIAGGSGDADLYVRRASQPTTSTFNCAPLQDINAEFCTFDSPQAGTWFVSIQAFRAYSGVSLTASIIQ